MENVIFINVERHRTAKRLIESCKLYNPEDAAKDRSIGIRSRITLARLRLDCWLSSDDELSRRKARTFPLSDILTLYTLTLLIRNFTRQDVVVDHIEVWRIWSYVHSWTVELTLEEKSHVSSCPDCLKLFRACLFADSPEEIGLPDLSRQLATNQR
jgi:hypothetical protein